MQLRDKDLWNKCVENNQDDYGSATINYAERWANLMEDAIMAGETVASCAEAAGHEADTEGITGFMYGAAVSTLSGVWVHGEELRKWHNLDTQLGDEGEKANKDGGVLNPAMLTIGKKTA